MADITRLGRFSTWAEPPLTPLVFHCESGRKALCESGGVLTWWRRWSNTNYSYVPVESPL